MKMRKYPVKGNTQLGQMAAAVTAAAAKSDTAAIC